MTSHAAMSEDARHGFSRDGSGSPLVGTFCLISPDRRIAKTRLFTTRYRDDWPVLAPSRCNQLAATGGVNQTPQLKSQPHAEKSWMVRFRRGCDFLGDCFSPSGIACVAMACMA
jgi:hypothetical protein